MPAVRARDSFHGALERGRGGLTLEKAAGQDLEVGKELQVSEHTEGSLGPGISPSNSRSWWHLARSARSAGLRYLRSPFPPGKSPSSLASGWEGARCCLHAATETQGLPTQRSPGILRLF